MSPVHSSIVRYGSSSRLRTSSAFAVSASSSSYDCSGVVNFTSSTLSNWCCRIRPRTSAPYEPGLAAEAGRVGRVADRQLAAVEDLAAVQVGQRHLRRRDQVEIPLPRDLEEILLELRQVAGAAQRFGVDEERRLDFDVAVLPRVQLQHEVDQRAREPGARADQHREPGAGHLRRTLEVEDAEGGSDLPVRPRREVERRAARRRGAPRRSRPRSRRPGRSHAARSAASSAGRCAAARPDRA